MAALSSLSKLNWREMITVANRLKIAGKAVRASEAPEGWIVPKVGPVFEGRPLPDPKVPGSIIYTPALATPPDVAVSLENYFGLPFRMLVGGKDIAPATAKVFNAMKVAKLPFSLFQHIDIGTRAALTHFTPTALGRGAPLKLPALGSRLVMGSVSKGTRQAIRTEILSGKPLYKDFPISFRDVLKEGGEFFGDTSMFERGLLETIGAIDVPKGAGTGGAALRRIAAVQQFVEQGLFEGLYRVAQTSALQEFVIPAVRRMHPTWSVKQVAAESATLMNQIFSTLGPWQTVFQDKGFGWFARRIIFSTNESEALLSQSFGLFRGPAKRFWLEWWAGVFLGLGAIANVVNVVATGKPLPLSSYQPVRLDDPYAPFKVGYTDRFMAPQMPFVKGRNGKPLYLDLVGQLDTPLRWLTDPVQAFAARVNVAPRVVFDQVRGETFFGEKMETPVQRATQAAIGAAAPIAAVQAIGAAREAVPALKPYVAEGESRLGIGGQLVQVTGLNLRSQPTVELLDSGARQMFNQSYSELEPYQKAMVRQHPSMTAELGERQRTGAQRNAPLSVAYKRLDELTYGPRGEIARLQEACLLYTSPSPRD